MFDSFIVDHGVTHAPSRYNRLDPVPILRLPTRALLLALATAAHAQAPPHKPHPKPQSPYNPNVVLLDPAHGGADNGAKLGDALEKDVTLAFAQRLKSLLISHGFTVLITHESASDQLAPDQRAELANRSRAVACLLLHASNGGHGVHIFTSSLASTAVSETPELPKSVLPWATAQSASIPQSLLLASDLADSLAAIRVPLVSAQASVPPIDSLTCPAVAIELAPLIAAQPSDDDATPAPTPATDPGYQQRIAVAVVTALDAWRGKILAGIEAANEAANPTPPVKAAPPPVRKPTKPIPIETPAGPPR